VPTVTGTRDAQRRVVITLALGQVASGLGMGASLSLGALLAAEVSGSPSWSGMGATMNTLGAALLAVPLARLAQARGRRVSLTTAAVTSAGGAALTIIATALHSFPLLLIALAALGAGTALNLQARFAATDLATDTTRGRDLSLVMWSTTIGAVAGPNLFDPGEALGNALGLPPLTGGFAVAVFAQLAGATLYFVKLRPDPLQIAAGRTGSAPQPAGRTTNGFRTMRTSPGARRAVLIVAFSHTVMVALMSMTPVHLTDHGASLNLVGLTISLHVAGMYALSPLFGWLADRIGARRTVGIGQGLFVASLLTSWIGADVKALVTASLILLGLGWSASIVAGSALVTASIPQPRRAGLQGVSDLVMNILGATGGALAGPVLAQVGFSGLSATLLTLVAVVLVLTATDSHPRKPSHRATHRQAAALSPLGR
jgi:MFS family permease